LLALLFSLLAATAPKAAELPGLPVFGDTFDVVGLFVENWEATKGTKAEGGRVLIPASNSLTLRRVPDGDFAITADLTVEKPSGPDIGHCGMTLDGIHFMVKPTSRPAGGTAYRVPGEARSRGTAGAIPGFEFGKPCRFQISRARLGKGYSYTFKANGQLVDAFSVVMPANGKVSFYGHKTNMEVDNFLLFALKGDASNNLTVNSSFEHLQEGMPLYMKPRQGGKYAFDGPWTNYIGSFAIDTQEKRSGRQSARMTCGPASPNSNGVGTHNANVMASTPVTFSVYLKASEDNFPVTLSLWELYHRTHTLAIRVSKSWERYSFTVAKPEKAIVRGNVTFSQAGTLWADDVQIEIGAEPTPYMASPLDSERFLPAETNTPALALDLGEAAPPQVGGALDCYTRLNYYMDEDAAVLAGTLALPDAETLRGRITLAGKTFEASLGSPFAIDIPLKGIKAGEHTVALAVLRGGKVVASATATLTKRAFQAGATQIDRQRRCLVVDGKPYLAITPFFGVERGIKTNDQERVLSNMLRLHKDMGYRCFLAGAVDNPPVDAQAQAFFDLCAKERIKIIYWPFQSWNRRDTIAPEQRMQSMKSGNILGWLIVDEPELYAKAEEVEPFMEAHRQASPYTPVFMNNTLIGIPGRFAGLKTDILMLDDYLTNSEGRKVSDMVRATTMMWDAGRKERLPVFYFLAGENLSNHYRECTYAEQVAQTYGVIIAGARGVSYFCSLPLYPEDYRACVDVNRELLALEDVIFSLEKTSPATVAGSSVVRMTRRLGDRLYVIALNADNDHAVEVEIGLPPEFRYAAYAEVKFESRKTKVANNKLAETFKPLERHVYVADILPQ
jgi:hypothetical protein